MKTRGATMDLSRKSRAAGLTLIEMMVTLLIGAFLMIGVISIFSQSRTTFRTNDTVERMQENLRFALATMQPDIRLARNWGLSSRASNVTLAAGVTATCPDGTDVGAWTLNPDVGVEASNGVYPPDLACAAFDDAFQAGSDVLVVRHASGQPTAATATVTQIQSDRAVSRVFDDGVTPAADDCPALPALQTRCTYDWQTHAYYVAATSSLGPNVPSLRRKSLVNGVLQDQELIPGVEDFQVQLGVDTDNDNTVERYVDADAPILDPADAAFIPDAKVLAVRLWLLFRAEQPETGFVDGATYSYADVANYQPADGFRRVLVNKTIVLRNARGITS